MSKKQIAICRAVAPQGSTLASPFGRGAPEGGRRGEKALSVTAFGGDSSPRGRAKQFVKLEFVGLLHRNNQRNNYDNLVIARAVGPWQSPGTIYCPALHFRLCTGGLPRRPFGTPRNDSGSGYMAALIQSALQTEFLHSMTQKGHTFRHTLFCILILPAGTPHGRTYPAFRR